MVVEILVLRLFFPPEKPEMSPGEWCGGPVGAPPKKTITSDREITCVLERN